MNSNNTSNILHVKSTWTKADPSVRVVVISLPMFTAVYCFRLLTTFPQINKGGTSLQACKLLAKHQQKNNVQLTSSLKLEKLFLLMTKPGFHRANLRSGHPREIANWPLNSSDLKLKFTHTSLLAQTIAFLRWLHLILGFHVTSVKF